MNYWLLKTEPTDYSYDDLVREKRAAWDGVRNNQALIYLREMKKGDRAFVYHTGKEKQVVGICDVVRGSYPDPEAENERFVLVDVRAASRLAKAVTLSDIKADKRFADFKLVRNSRLSVMPVSLEQWTLILAMADSAS